MQLSPQKLPGNRAHHQHLPWEPAGPQAEQDLPCSAKRAPQAFGNPRGRDQGEKKKKTVEKHHCPQKVPSGNAHRAWLAHKRGPKRAHQKFQSLSLKCQRCLFFHTATTPCSPQRTQQLTEQPVPPQVCSLTHGQEGSWTHSAWLAPSPATTVMHHSTDNGSSSWVCGVFFGKLIFFLLFFVFI